VQVKCPYRRKIVPGTVPHHYYAQVQLNVFICGLSHADFVEFRPEPNFVLSIVRVYPDRAWLAESIPKMRAFHELMVRYAGDKIVEHPKYAKYAARYGPDAKRVPRALAPKASAVIGNSNGEAVGAGEAGEAVGAVGVGAVPLETPWLGDSFF
jgi:hypothetical protein